MSDKITVYFASRQTNSYQLYAKDFFVEETQAIEHIK